MVAFPVTTLPKIPSDLSFQAAIEVTQQLLSHIDRPAAPGQDDADNTISEAVSAIVQQKPGARGFFVAYLTGEHSALNPPHPAIVSGLQRWPDQSVDLLPKNLAMSTAMAVAHSREGNADMAQQSARVRSRTLDLMVALQLSAIPGELAQLRDSAHPANDADGPYTPFLTRWGYDAEQRHHIYSAASEALAQLDMPPSQSDLP